MDSPAVSVIMPTLNDAEYIERAVESILDQSHSDFELIIIDDGSTDGTVERIKQFTDERLYLVQRKDETGVASARNEAISRASGEYIAVHDADDWSHPDRFKTQVEYLDENPEVALVGTGSYLVDEDGNIQSRRHVLESLSITDLKIHNEFVHGSVLMRRCALNMVGDYDERFDVAEDYDLWLRFTSKYKIRNIDEPLYYFRQHNESSYASNLTKTKLYHLLALRRAQNHLDDEIHSSVEKNGIETYYNKLDTEEKVWFHTELAREQLRYGNLTSGREHAKEAIRLNPSNITLLGMVLLSLTTPFVVKSVARTYRQIINGRIQLQNWWSTSCLSSNLSHDDNKYN